MKENNMVAMILAGGRGSRLFDLTKTIAKPAVHFVGCSADDGGAISSSGSYWVSCSVSGCSFVGCSANGGGAICSLVDDGSNSYLSVS